MNEELKNQLSTFLAKALDVADKGIDTAGEQIPALLQEIVYCELWSSVGFIAMFITLSITLFFVANYLNKRCKEVEGAEDFSMLYMIALGIFFATLLVNVPTIIKTLVAPRLVILEYLKGLL